MKFSFAVACLIGVTTAIKNEPIWNLRSVNSNANNAKEQVAYGEFSTEMSNKKMKDWTHIQTKL